MLWRRIITVVFDAVKSVRRSVFKDEEKVLIREHPAWKRSGYATLKEKLERFKQGADGFYSNAPERFASDLEQFMRAEFSTAAERKRAKEVIAELKRNPPKVAHCTKCKRFAFVKPTLCYWCRRDNKPKALQAKKAKGKGRGTRHDKRAGAKNSAARNTGTKAKGNR